MLEIEYKEIQPIFTAECQGTLVKIGDWFVCSYGYSYPIGRCTQVLPTGLMLAFRWGTLWPIQNYISYDRILGRAEVGFFKKLIG